MEKYVADYVLFGIVWFLFDAILYLLHSKHFSINLLVFMFGTNILYLYV